LAYFLFCFLFYWFGTDKGVPYRGRGREKRFTKNVVKNIWYYWAFTPAGAVVMVRASWTALRPADNL